MANPSSYLSVTGVPGESIAPGHEGWIDVLTVSFAFESLKGNTAPGSDGSVGGSGAVNEVTLTARTGSHSADVQSAAITGKHYASALLDLSADAGFRRIKLNDVLVASFRTQDRGAGDPTPTDVFTLQTRKGITTERIAAPPAKPIDPKSPAGRALASRLKKAMLHVRVVDENGKERVPKGGDRVMASDRLKYDPDDGFVRELDGKGELLVSVRYDGFEPVEQWFRYDAPAKQPTFAPFWPGTDDDPDTKGRRRDGYLLACMQLNRAAGGHDDERSPKVFNLTVTLHPTRMFVAVIGCDYWEEADQPNAHHRSLDFDKYTLTYADHLSAAGVLNLSSAFTLIDCPRGRIERWDRVRAEGTNSVVWKRHFILQKREPCPKWGSGKAFDAWRTSMLTNPSQANKYYGATDVYYYLDGVGGRTPGAVVDFSIFSHAWHGGPILYDTNSSPDPEHETTARFAGDLDMRFRKDFIAANNSLWNKMPNAFAADGTVHVWGCFATDVFNEMVRFLLGEGGTKGRFVSKDPKLDLDRAGVVSVIKKAIESESFMSRIAKFTKRNTFGGLPGFGADNAEYGSIPTLPANLKSKIRGQIMHVPRITTESRFRKLFESVDLGEQRFNEFGYMLYKP
jgi:hypothetical protein